MTPAQIIRAAIPGCDDETVEHVLWGRTPFPCGAITAKSLYKAASGWRRAGAKSDARTGRDAAAALLRISRAQERAIRRRAADMARHSEEVQQRARDLLLRHLSEEQRESFLANKFFVVEGRSGDRYRIEDRGHMVGNVGVLTRHVGVEVIRHRLCGHCDRSIPLADQLLAQKLMIEGAEDEFLRIANRHAA